MLCRAEVIDSKSNGHPPLNKPASPPPQHQFTTLHYQTMDSNSWQNTYK